MDKKSYIQILNRPELISEEVSLELKKICDKYPYFQSAQALNLKVLKNKNSFKYNNELKISRYQIDFNKNAYISLR